MAYTKQITSTVSYLIGLDKQWFGDTDEPQIFAGLDRYNELEKQKAPKIIRSLCIIRNELLNNWTPINRKFSDVKKGMIMGSFWLHEYVGEDNVRFLESCGIRLKLQSSAETCVANVNTYICDRINNCRNLFPEYVDWSLLKALFIMPAGLQERGCRDAWSVFIMNKTCYPFSCYVSWKKMKEIRGKALFNDSYFLEALYDDNGKKFDNPSLVSDNAVVNSGTVSHFLEIEGDTDIVIDCENANPFFIYSFLNNISDKDYNYIKKVLLFLDPNSSSAWKFLKNMFQDIEFEEILCERVLGRKSLVDIRMTAKTVKEFYENKIRSFILVSSDSDFYGMIQELPEASFMLAVQRENTAEEMLSEVSQKRISYIFVEDYSYADVYEFKKTVIMADFKSQIRETWQPINFGSLLKQLEQDIHAHLTDTEKNAILDGLCKKIQVDTSDISNIHIKFD